MNKFVTPVVLNADGTKHVSLLPGEALAVESIPVSDSKQNLLEKDDSGLVLASSMIVSGQENNPIVINVDGKLFVRTKSMLSPEDKVLKVADNLLMADVSLAFDPASSKLTLCGKNNTVISELSLPVAPGLPVLVEVLQDFTPPKPDGFVENPYQPGTYLHMQFQVAGGKTSDVYLDLSKLVDVYTGGKGITVKDNTVSVAIKPGSVLYFAECCSDPDCSCPAPLDVSVPALAEQLVSPDDKILTVQNGKLATVLRLAYDADKQIITLLGKNDEFLGEVQLPKVSGITADDLGEGLMIGPDGKVSVDWTAVAAKLAVGVSSDEDNILSVGSDGKPFFPGDLGSL